MAVDTLIIVGGPEDLSESLITAMDEVVAGRNMLVNGVRNIKKDHSILKMLHLLGHLQKKTDSEASIEIMVTKKYFNHLNNVVLSHEPTKNKITIYTEKDGGFEIWGYL